MNETIIASVITALLTYFGTKKQTEYQLKGKEIEADANTEGMYVQNMSMILAEYKEQVSGFRDELKQVKQEFAAFSVCIIFLKPPIFNIKNVICEYQSQ